MTSLLLSRPTSRGFTSMPDGPLDPPSERGFECSECYSEGLPPHICTLGRRNDCGGCDFCCPDRLYCFECGNRATEGCLCEEVAS